MNDQNFHEIQLSGKQLLFGFISAVVLLVVIFLLGVSVGRGVRNEVAPGEPGNTAAVPGATDSVVAATPPASAAPQPGDLNYQQVLKGQPQAGTPSNNPPPPADPPAPASPPGEGMAQKGQRPAPAGTSPQSATQKPAPTQTPPPASETKSGAPTSGGWFAQVGAFGTRQAALARQKELAAKGFSGTVTPYGAFFRVRVGPFATQAEAEREKARLAKAGIESSVIR